MRSLLITPADSPRTIETALSSGADAVVLDLLDLEDSSAPQSRETARRGVRDILSSALSSPRTSGPRLLVRVNGLASGQIEADLDAIAEFAPFAIVLPNACGGDDAQHLSIKLAVREAQCGLPDGSIGVLPIATDNAGALFRLSTYRGCTARLAALAWSAGRLTAHIGALDNRLPGGDWTPPFALARNLALFAAASAGVPAIDAAFACNGDAQALRRECAQARRDGFSGKLAIHPDQVAIINKTFAQARDEIAPAR